jgi:general nucleoside transport system permease protein
MGMSGPSELPRFADVILLPLLNVAAAFLASGLVVLIIGENPLEAVIILVRGAFGYAEGIGFTLFYATNFIFTGLAVAIASHAGLFNIGGDGQAYVAGLGVALACIYLPGAPFIVVLVAAILGSMLFGAAWAFIPGYLQAKRGSHVVITTIMFNFIASALMVYLLVDVLKPPASMSPESAQFPPDTLLPMVHDLWKPLGFELEFSRLNISFLLALAAAVATWLLIWKTRLGYEIRTVGHNPVAAVYAGISPQRITIIAMLISGGVAGLMAINVLMGDQQRLVLDYTSGAGFVGIAVALMGRSHPFGIVLASILFGALYQGGAELAFDKPAINRDMIVVIQGLVILFAGALEHMFKPQLAALLAVLRPSARTAEA